VSTIGLGARPVEATVEVSGLPDSCSNKASCTRQLAIVEYGNIFDMYEAPQNLKDRNQMLDNFAGILRQAPEFKGYLVTYGGRISYLGEAVERAAKMKRYLVEVDKLDASRIEIIDGGYCDEWRVELWVWVRDAPVKVATTPCLDPKEVKIIKKEPR